MDSTITTTIPPDLLARLEGLRDILSANGAVICRKEPDRRIGWRVRYRDRAENGRRAHRSIPLDSEPVALAVKALLAGWQHERRQQLQEARQARQQADQRSRQRHRRLRRMVVTLAGGGRKRRRRIGRLYDEAAAEGLEQEAIFILSEGYKQPNRRPGRHWRGQLVLME